MTQLFIKNMVCNRCKAVVRKELEGLGLHPEKVDLGEVTLAEPITTDLKTRIDEVLRTHGFELMDDKRSRMIEKIKSIIIHQVHHADEPLPVNLSTHLSRELHLEYSYLSSLFASVEGTTIEQYYIQQKIERVKELLVYDELTLSEIADQLHYSSVSHLSHQFKKVTGLTPTHFKQLRELKRQSLDEL